MALDPVAPVKRCPVNIRWKMAFLKTRINKKTFCESDQRVHKWHAKSIFDTKNDQNEHFRGGFPEKMPILIILGCISSGLAGPNVEFYIDERTGKK